MRSAKRILRIIVAASALLLFICPGCVSTRNDYISRKKAESTCDLTRLGRNKYFYSGQYQKKLHRSIREIKNH